MTDKFTKPLDEWVKEPKEIDVIEPVIEDGRVTGLQKGKRTVYETVRYTRIGKPKKVSCGDLQHSWHIPDKHNHVAHCKNCSKRYFIRAVFEKVKDGKILNRDTNEPIA